MFRFTSARVATFAGRGLRQEPQTEVAAVYASALVQRGTAAERAEAKRYKRMIRARKYAQARANPKRAQRFQAKLHGRGLRSLQYALARANPKYARRLARRYGRTL